MGQLAHIIHKDYSARVSAGVSGRGELSGHPQIFSRGVRTKELAGCPGYPFTVRTPPHLLYMRYEAIMSNYGKICLNVVKQWTNYELKLIISLPHLAEVLIIQS